MRGHAAIFADDPAFAVVAGAGVHVAVFDPRPARDDVPLPLQIGAQLGLDVRLDDFALVMAASGSGHVGRDRAPIALAPGSGGVAKCWPRDRWLDLARALARDGEHLQVVVGPAERERDDPSRWPWPAGTGVLAGLSCVDLAQRLATAAAFVGNDSGTTHLAAALGVATVAIFGPSNARVFAPPGRRVRVVAAGGTPPAATVDSVRAALRGLRGPA